MVRLAKITKNRLGAPVWAHILYLSCGIVLVMSLVSEHNINKSGK